MAFVADFWKQSFHLKTKFDMENNTSINHENGNDANRLCAPFFLKELAQLMEKHKATLIIERVWDGEYDSHAELDFMINGVFVQGGFHAEPIKEINHDAISRLS